MFKAHMYFDGRSDGRERCGSEGIKTGLKRFQIKNLLFFFVPGNHFSATVITLQPSPNLSLHLSP